jgi:hypothetical protein
MRKKNVQEVSIDQFILTLPLFLLLLLEKKYKTAKKKKTNMSIFNLVRVQLHHHCHQK